MTTVKICGECGGTGTVPIENAYDPNDVTHSLCGDCGGDGIMDNDDIGSVVRIMRRQRKFKETN